MTVKAVTSLGRALAILDNDPSATWPDLSAAMGTNSDARSALVGRYGLMACALDGTITITDRGRARLLAEDRVLSFMVAEAGRTVALGTIEQTLRGSCAGAMSPRLLVHILDSAGAERVSRRIWRMPRGSEAAGWGRARWYRHGLTATL